MEYCTDILEPGNPGGWTNSLKTFDDEWTLSPGEEVDVDIWLNDVQDILVYAGFWIEYDPSLVSIIDVKAYDGSIISGPWDPYLSFYFPGPEGFLVHHHR